MTRQSVPPKRPIHFYQARRLHVPDRYLQLKCHENLRTQLYPSISKTVSSTEVFHQYVACISPKHAAILPSPLIHLLFLQGNQTRCPYTCSTCIGRVIQNTHTTFFTFCNSKLLSLIYVLKTTASTIWPVLHNASFVRACWYTILRGLQF